MQAASLEIAGVGVAAFLLGWLVMGWLTWGSPGGELGAAVSRSGRVDELASEMRRVAERMAKLEHELSAARSRALRAERELTTARSAITGLEFDIDDLSDRLLDRDAEVRGLVDWAKSLQDERSRVAGELRSVRLRAVRDVGTGDA